MSLPRVRLSVLVALVTAAGLLLSPASTRADAVTEWNKVSADGVVGVAGQGAGGTANLAVVQAAVFDAVNSIDRRYEPYLVRVPAKRWYSQDAAVAAAARRVLLDGGVVNSTQQAALDTAANDQYAKTLATIPDGKAKDGGIATGEAAASMMIAARFDDGRLGPGGFENVPLPAPPFGPVGLWQPAPVNDPGAWLRNVTPFLLEHPRHFFSRGPFPLTSRRYAAEFNEVKAIGRKEGSTRLPEQTIAAQFWGGPTNAVLTWSQLIRAVAAERTMSTVEQARFYALVYLNAADSLIVTWKDKQRWVFWRPVAAIPRAAEDGNPATEPDAAWTPLIPTPPYPDHPSGLAAFGASNVATMQELLGTNKVSFGTTNSIGMTRSYERLSQAIDEIVDARVWSGLHFRTADVQGAEIGRDVARWRRDHGFLRPLGHHR